MNGEFEPPHPNGAVHHRGGSPAHPGRRRLFQATVIVVALAWGFAFWWMWTHRGSPERLDPAAHEQLAAVCSQARDELRALPDLGPQPTGPEYVSLVQQENAIFDDMTRQFEGVTPDEKDSRAALDAWTKDWTDLIGARRAFAADLAEDGTARLRIPSVRPGSLEPITERMNTYARARDLPDCTAEALQVEVVDQPRDYDMSEDA